MYHPGYVFSLTYFPGYFKKSSPDFINYKGQSLSGPLQVEALAQAQSIGMCGWCGVRPRLTHLQCTCQYSSRSASTWVAAFHSFTTINPASHRFLRSRRDSTCHSGRPLLAISTTLSGSLQAAHLSCSLFTHHHFMLSLAALTNCFRCTGSSQSPLVV